MTEQEERLRREEKHREREKEIARRKEENTKKIRKTVIIVIVGIFVLFALFCFLPVLKSRDNINKHKDDEASAQTETVDENRENDDALIYTLDNGQILNGISLKKGNVIVTTNSLISFKSGGKIKDNTKIGYASPVVKSAGDKYIVFERSTGKFTIMNSSGLIYQRDSGNEIINADISSNGNYALITRNTQTSSTVYVYNLSGKELFVCDITDDYLMDIALSPDGKAVAVSALKIVNGQECSKVYYFKNDAKDDSISIEYEGEVVYKISFVDKKKVAVVTNLSYNVADFSTVENKSISYDYDKIAGCITDGNGLVAVLKTEFGTLDKNTVSIYNSDCKEICTSSVEQDVLSFAISSKNLYVLSPGCISKYKIKSSEKVREKEVNGSITKILVSGNNVFGFSDNSAYGYSF